MAPITYYSTKEMEKLIRKALGQRENPDGYSILGLLYYLSEHTVDVL